MTTTGGEVQAVDRIGYLEQLLSGLYQNADDEKKEVIAVAWQEIGAMQVQLDKWAEMAIKAKNAAHEYQEKLYEALALKSEFEHQIQEIEEMNPDNPLVASIMQLVEEDSAMSYDSMFVSEDPAADIASTTGADYMSAECFFEIIFGFGLRKPSWQTLEMAREAIETVARKFNEGNE